MPRKSVIEEIGVKVNCSKDRGTYIVVYDFETGAGGKIPTRFYSNLNRLCVKRLQKSVVVCGSKRDAVLVALLVRHYGGEARVFKVSEEIEVKSS